MLQLIVFHILRIKNTTRLIYIVREFARSVFVFRTPQVDRTIFAIGGLVVRSLPPRCRFFFIGRCVTRIQENITHVLPLNDRASTVFLELPHFLNLHAFTLL